MVMVVLIFIDNKMRITKLYDLVDSFTDIHARHERAHLENHKIIDESILNLSKAGNNTVSAVSLLQNIVDNIRANPVYCSPSVTSQPDVYHEKD